NFVQILLEQTSLRIPRMIMRTQSGGSEISNWYEQGSRHLPGGAEEMEGFTRHNVICAVSGGIVNISGHVGGTFGTVFSTSRVLKLVDSITPTGIHYGVCTFTTSGNIPTGVAVARVNGDGYVEIIGESEHEGNAHFNIQYQLSK